MLRMHNSHRNTNLSSVAVAALIGGLAGAVVGLMVAPKSGKELRQGICKKANKTIEHAEDVAAQQTGVLKQKGTELVGKGKQLAEDLQTFIQEALKMRKSSYIHIEAAADTVTDIDIANIDTVEDIDTIDDIDTAAHIQTKESLSDNIDNTFNTANTNNAEIEPKVP